MRTIEHWIGGKHVEPAGRIGSRDVFDPARGAPQAQVRLATADEVDAAVAARRRPRSRAGAQSSVTRARPGHVRVPRAARQARGRAREDHLVRARQDDRRRARRGRSRPRGRRVRLRHPAAAQGRVLRPGLRRRRLVLVPPAARRRAPASRRSTSRSWCRCGCTPSRSRPATRSSSSRASGTRGASDLVAELYAEAGLPDGVFNVVHGDKVAVDAILDHPDIAAVSFVGSTPIAKYVHERAIASGKRVQALGGAKNHAVVMPDADLDFAADHLVAAGYGSAGQRCMAISAVVAVGAGRRRAGRARSEKRTSRSRSAPATSRASRWVRSSPPASRDRIVGYIDAGRVRRRERRRRRPRAWSSTVTRTASSSGRRCSTPSPPTCRSTPTRSSGPC